MQTTRTRNNRITIRLDDAEFAQLESRMQSVGLNNRERFARKMLLDGYIIITDMKPISELARLVRISANNINQIAKRANETGTIYETDVLQLLEEVSSLKPLINEAYRSLIQYTVQ